MKQSITRMCSNTLKGKPKKILGGNKNDKEDFSKIQDFFKKFATLLQKKWVALLCIVL